MPESCAEWATLAISLALACKRVLLSAGAAPPQRGGLMSLVIAIGAPFWLPGIYNLPVLTVIPLSPRRAALTRSTVRRLRLRGPRSIGHDNSVSGSVSLLVWRGLTGDHNVELERSRSAIWGRASRQRAPASV
jgi:hypothetical protein